MTVNVTIVFSSTPGVSFVSAPRVDRVEVIDHHSDNAINFSGPGVQAAKEAVDAINETIGAKRFAVTVNGVWA
jgi:hypothetical protein